MAELIDVVNASELSLNKNTSIAIIEILLEGEKYYIDNNSNKYLSDIKSLSILITHEYEQLTHIDNDTDDIRNPKFTKEYYGLLENLYKKISTNSLVMDDVTEEIKKDIFKN